jgi:general secretion pathway protein J
VTGRPHRAAASGFTLLELIVVLLIFSIMSILAYGGLRSVLDTRVGVEAAMDRTAEFQRSYRRVRDDIRQLSARDIRDAFGDRQPPFMAQREADVMFTRAGWQNPLRQPRTTFQRVRYRLTEGTLFRDSWRVLDMAQDSEPVELGLLEDVESVAWRFLDANQEWRDEWPGEGNELPLMVEITLETKDWGELQWRFKAGIPPTASQIIQSAGQGPPTDPDANPGTGDGGGDTAGGGNDPAPETTPPPTPGTAAPGIPFN